MLSTVLNWAVQITYKKEIQLSMSASNNMQLTFHLCICSSFRMVATSNSLSEII